MELDQIKQEDISQYYVCDTCHKLFTTTETVNLDILGILGRCKTCGSQEREETIKKEKESQIQKNIERFNNIRKYIEDKKKSN